MDLELFYNGSGIKDPTAYKAMTMMEVDDMGFMRGEIYEVENIYNPSEPRFALVVSADFRANDRVISIIMLSEEPKCDDFEDVRISCRGMKYAPPTGVQYIFSDKLTEFIRCATEEEMTAVDRQMAKYLGLDTPKEVIKEVVKESHPVESIINPNLDDLIEARTEARIYKELCERLLNR